MESQERSQLERAALDQAGAQSAEQLAEQAALDQEQDQEQARVAEEARMHASVRILVVDNDVETADRAIFFLERAGYASEIATDGASALSLAERFRPHIVILGAITNSVNPTEFARLLRLSALETSSGSGLGEVNLPIIYLLDRAHLLQQRLHTLGTTPLQEAIFKPLDERELLDKVARALLANG